jgi:hypothetical protein
MFNPIEIDRSNLTIMGVKFSDLKSLESTANALGSICLKVMNRLQKALKLYGTMLQEK